MNEIAEFSLDELKKINGKNKNKTYVACNGLVYGVTESFLWKDGKHLALHIAGKDLSNEIKDAPHGIKFLEKFPIAGRVKS